MMEPGAEVVADLRIQHTDASAERPVAVSHDAGSGGRGPGHEPEPHAERAPGAEELAVALSESDRGESLTARFELGSEGEPLIRITDRSRNETVALITPEELKALAEDTGLPPGLLLRVSS